VPPGEVDRCERQFWRREKIRVPFVQFRLHRPAVSEHLQVLRTARLVRDERRGRERYYHLEPARLIEVNEWLKPFEHDWRERMKALESVLDEEER
jgi:DNA-binding transcriptional ArsR family regulator